MSRSFFLFVFFWVFSPFLSAQIDGLYDLDDFGATTQAPNSHVSLSCQFNENYLVARASISPNWHLYSITQPEGATIRSTFKIESPELQLQEIRPTTAPHVDSDNVFKVDLEEHENSVTWILTFQDKLPNDKTIKGKFDGMVCQTGEGGMCIPLRTISFDAKFNPNLDVKPLLEQAEAVAERFVWRFEVSPDTPKDTDQKPVADVARDSVIPVQEGSQMEGVNPVPLDSHLRRNDKNVDSEIDLVITPKKTTTESFSLHGTTFEAQESVSVTNFWRALLYAFLGGIILNVMPCVLPVIGLKILSFFEQAGKSRTRALMLNICYSLGLLTVFIFLAFLSLGLSVLFTFDLFGIIMACIVFVMALSLMDIWTLGVPSWLGGKTSGTLTKQEGVWGAYFKGIITTLLAIPCGAPLLSPAITWADMQIRSGNMPEVFLMYSVIGFGMALPYLVLGAFPELLRFLPKPGAWMETFKKTMGFCLLLAVVWILYFVPVEKLLPTVALLFALWFICWSLGEQQLVGRAHKRTYIISPIVLGLAIVLSFQIPSIPNPYTLESAMQARLERREAKGFTEGRIIGKEEGLAEGEMKGKAEMAQNLLHLDAQLSTLIKEAMGDLLSVEMASPRHHGEHWKPYSDAALESALSSGKVVIIDFTADWCVNCKVLAATVLQTETTLTLLEDKQIVSLEADCTRDGEARNLLLRLGPELVPTLAIFDPAEPSKPTMIRGGYTQKTLTERLGGK